MREPNLSLRVAHTLRPVEKWVATGPDANWVKLRASMLATGVNVKAAKAAYTPLIQAWCHAYLDVHCIFVDLARDGP